MTEYDLRAESEWVLHEEAGYDFFDLPKLTQAEVNRLTAGMQVRSDRREYRREIEERKRKQSRDYGSGQLSAGNDARVESHKQRIAENQHRHIQEKMREKAQDN